MVSLIIVDSEFWANQQNGKNNKKVINWYTWGWIPVMGKTG